MERKYPTMPISLPATTTEDQIEESDPVNDRKVGRRNKNDFEGRTYKCGCGKMYLSYPALYTHIKTKHEGITPDGTNAPQFKNGRGRGRPRKTKDTTAPMKEHAEHPSDNIRNNPDFADEIYYLREIGHHFSEGTDPFSGFPHLYVKNSEIEHPLKPVLQQEHENHEKARNGIYVEPGLNVCERVLAKFLWEHAKVCDSDFYQVLLKVVVFLYKYLDEEVMENYCKDKTCEELPCELNGFLQYLEARNLVDKEEDIVGLIKHLGAWLYSHGFTHIPLIEN